MLLLLLALPAAATLPASSLGPGRGEWQRGRPEDHNLTAPLLEDAARQLQREAPVKECFAVAKDGELLYELDYRREAGKPAPLIESDSAGKTITALLVGVLVTKHSLDLDSTLESHGVRPQADWGPGNKYFPNVTIRHVLSQTSGVGKYEPGEAFTYDSGDYLQHLTALIAAVSGQAPKAWAKESLGVPLGIPELYANDSYTAINPSDDDNITAGGSQFLSCVQMLRFGQLMNNRGWWPDAEGTPTRLISEAYIEQMLTPQYPNAIQNYGLLTWLTTEGPPVRGTGGVTGCCQPQWGCFGHEHLDGGGEVSAADGGRWGALMPGETILSEAALLEGPEHGGQDGVDGGQLALRNIGRGVLERAAPRARHGGASRVVARIRVGFADEFGERAGGGRGGSAQGTLAPGVLRVDVVGLGAVPLERNGR